MFGFCFNFCRNSTKDSLDFAPHMLSPFLRLDICDHEVEMAILGSRKVKNKKTLAKPHDSTNTYAKLTKIDMTTKRCIDTQNFKYFSSAASLADLGHFWMPCLVSCVWARPPDWGVEVRGHAQLGHQPAQGLGQVSLSVSLALSLSSPLI